MERMKIKKLMGVLLAAVMVFGMGEPARNRY
jgi:hypothetical protein